MGDKPSVELAGLPSRKAMTGDSRFRSGVVVVVVVLVGLALWRGVKAANFSPAEAAEQRKAEGAALLAVEEMHVTDAGAGLLPVTPADPIIVTVPVTVTRVVTVEVAGPVVYVNVPGPERLVEVAGPEVVREVLPVAPAVGLVAICVLGEGLTGIYLGDVGIPGNSCTVVPASALSQVYTVTVTR